MLTLTSVRAFLGVAMHRLVFNIGLEIFALHANSGHALLLLNVAGGVLLRTDHTKRVFRTEEFAPPRGKAL